ncbi:hypothetical protein K438DRAFT_1961985 [Mycena galopus ATCC 62051]|nr:hypothetical protein K438DRAFT_1961985 [Mycena galopus ATCC 62051]
MSDVTSHQPSRRTHARRRPTSEPLPDVLARLRVARARRSCPVTGVSRGFTDEADQQCALIEMHGFEAYAHLLRDGQIQAPAARPPPDSHADGGVLHRRRRGEGARRPGIPALTTTLSQQQQQQQQQQVVGTPRSPPPTNGATRRRRARSWGTERGAAHEHGSVQYAQVCRATRCGRSAPVGRIVGAGTRLRPGDCEDAGAFGGRESDSVEMIWEREESVWIKRRKRLHRQRRLPQVQAQAPPPTVPQVQAPVVPGNAADANGSGGIPPAMLGGMTPDQLQKVRYATRRSQCACLPACYRAPPNPYSAPAPPARSVNGGGGGYNAVGWGGGVAAGTRARRRRSRSRSSRSSSSSVRARRGAALHGRAHQGAPWRWGRGLVCVPRALGVCRRHVHGQQCNAFVGGTSSVSPFLPDPSQLPQQQQQQHQGQRHGTRGLYAAAELSMLETRRDSYAGKGCRT